MFAQDNGFKDVVAIVHDNAETARRLQAALGFAILGQGTVDPNALEVLGLDPAWQASEILIGDPAQGRGNIRLISVQEQKLPVKRDGCQAWDTGGIFDFNIRALQSIDDVQSKMSFEGFVGHSPVIHWQFGPLDVKEVVMRDGDGLCIAFMQRLAPPLTGYEDVTGPVSYVFNSTQVVADFAAARAFYVDVLGWKVVQETTMRQEQGDNCMGLPLDIARDREIQIGIYHPLGKMEGSVEIIAFDVEGRDYSAAPVAARGIASLRFPVSDPQEMLTRAQGAGCEILPLRQAYVAPYGAVELGGFVTPWGARFEVFRTL
jgi:catechol 2,3-dioxygenase-like lactoylglutathione lyase family enzyme